MTTETPRLDRSSHPSTGFPGYSLPITIVMAWCCFVYLRKRLAPSLSNIAGPSPNSFILGNIPQLISEDGYDFHTDLARNYGGVVKLHAICGAKQLYVFDHAAMHSVLIKDEHIYNMPDAFLAANHLMFGPCLVSTSGQRHRRGRKIMNPTFSPARLREMFPILFGIAHKTNVTILEASVDSKNGETDMLHILGTTALEFIGQAGLGHSFAASRSGTLEGMKQLLFAAKRMIVPMQALPFLLRIAPSTFRRKLIDLVPLPDLHLARDLVDILDKNSRAILKGKREAIAKGGSAIIEQFGQGKDAMSLLMRADQLSEEELLGQMNVLIFAGTDTTSTAMCRCLQELARHPTIQAQLRDEVTKADAHGDIDFDVISTLPVLDAVCKETLRMYPPAVTSSRQASEDVMMPLSAPMIGVDNSTITEILVPAGTIVHVGIKAANQSRVVWGPDALEWKPERWLSPLPQTVLDANIPGVYPKLMTFIGGPRGCIGFKFAEMSMKVLLVVLLKEFEFALSNKEIVWKLGVAEAPTVEGKQSFPMLVTRIQG
ncbi:cytochrome P450 [Collybia nuda]|uniref:Cytochrome P450 n=1 Tax=Collybia nuda TaxID=64659 RepID=A0A9P6C863_9AGAR|nr:cytochrome P450 [Collybia nuda]